MANIGTYSGTYIPFTPWNILPEPTDMLSWDWMETVSQFSQRFTKIATFIATVAGGGSYIMDYSSLGCDFFPPLIKGYVYGTLSHRWESEWKYQQGTANILQGITLTNATFINNSGYSNTLLFIVMW